MCLAGGSRKRIYLVDLGNDQPQHIWKLRTQPTEPVGGAIRFVVGGGMKRGNALGHINNDDVEII